jgi:hypothetical protein
MWPDEPMFEVRLQNDRKVWEINQACIRPGCERTRKTRLVRMTMELISITYGGRLESVGRLPRTEMRQEILDAQQG